MREGSRIMSMQGEGLPPGGPAEMHEIGITREMFDLVLKEAEKAGARKVDKIDLVIGEMTGAVGESVRFYFDLLSKGTIVEGAEVSIRMVSPMVMCQNCNKTSKLERKTYWTCPYCEDNRMEIIAGGELMVKSIGVEIDGDQGT